MPISPLSEKLGRMALKIVLMQSLHWRRLSPLLPSNFSARVLLWDLITLSLVSTSIIGSFGSFNLVPIF